MFNNWKAQYCNIIVLFSFVDALQSVPETLKEDNFNISDSQQMHKQAILDIAPPSTSRSWNSVNKNSLLLGNFNYRYPNSPPQTDVNKQWRHIGGSLYCVGEDQFNAAFRDTWLLSHLYNTDGAGDWWMIKWKGFRRKWPWPNQGITTGLQKTR